jgi:hypothetical protein
MSLKFHLKTKYELIQNRFAYQMACLFDPNLINMGDFNRFYVLQKTAKNLVAFPNRVDP